MTNLQGRSLLKRRAHSVVALLMIFLLCSVTAIAQFGFDKLIKIHGVHALDLNRAKAFVSVVQEQRIPLTEERIMGLSPLNLDIDAFEIYIDGKQLNTMQAEVFEFSPEGIDVVLAIDISGTVYENFDLVKNAINAYIDNRRAGKDQIAILTFGSDFKVPMFSIPELGESSAFTDDVNQLKQVIEKKPPRDRMQRTVLFKATQKAVQLAAQGRLDPGGRTVEKVVIVLSDGHEEGTGFTIDDCIWEAKAQHIPIFALAVPEPMEKNQYHDNLEKMAAATGGVFAPVNELHHLKDVYRKLDELVKNQYVLTFEIPAEFADGEPHELHISATDDGRVVSTKTTFVTPELPRTTREENPLKPESRKQLSSKKKSWVWPVILFGVAVVIAIPFVMRFVTNRRATVAGSDNPWPPDVGSDDDEDMM